jgi:hypothetical protein
VRHILEDWDAVQEELGGTVHYYIDEKGSKSAGSPRTLIQDEYRTGPWTDPAEKQKAFTWLRPRTNEFLNAFRPRIRAAAADLNLESR